MLDSDGLAMPPKATTSCTDGNFFASPSKPFAVAVGTPENCLVTTVGDKEFSLSKIAFIPVFFLGETTVITELVAAEDLS
jgi:hypothetical protein